MPDNLSISTLPSEITWEIVHKIPGRLRLRIPRVAWDELYRSKLEKLLLKTIAITGSIFNKFAGSVTVYYEENIPEPVILEYLSQTIEKANRDLTKESTVEPPTENMGLPAVAVTVALIALPLELPMFLTGGLIFAAALPLWERVSAGITEQGEINIDTLDIIWLSAQIIQGNHIAGALALNLATISENLRQDRLRKLSDELYTLFELEEEKIHWLSARESFLPIRQEVREQWLESVEDTALMQRIKPIATGAILPTLILSAAVGLWTDDIGRASALLPLDLGVSLRGATPLAVVSALVSAARANVYIRDGKTLEKLATVDTLIFSAKAFLNLIFSKQSIVPFEKTIEDLRQRYLSLYVVVETPEDEELINDLTGVVDKVFIALNKEDLNLSIDMLISEGNQVVWIDDTTGDELTGDRSHVTVTLAAGNHETAADVILGNHDLRSLLYTIDLARDTFQRAYGSLAIATIPNLIAVSIGVIWGLDPIVAVVINGVSAISGELNSLTAR